VIIVTGASSGIGKVMAVHLAKHGHIVYGTSRSIKNQSNAFYSLEMDVCNEDSVLTGINRIIHEQGRIDAVINNAGIGMAGVPESLSINDAEKVFNTNVLGVIRVCEAVLPIMRKNKSGRIINISSIAAEMGLPYRGIYSASKAAVQRYTEALRMEVKKFGIEACTVQPGGIATDINTNRLISPIPSNSPYKESFERTYDIINHSVSKGMAAEKFGPYIEELLNAAKLKRNYRIGNGSEKLSVLIKKIMPDYVFEKIISNHYKL
jgi:short-subunit dehydrogenase